MATLALPFLLVSGASPLLAQPASHDAGQTPEASDGGAAPPAPSPLFLWEARRGDSTSYLLGTCHIGVSLEDALPGSTRNHLNDARTVVLEADASQAHEALQEMMLPEGESLQSLVSEEAWEVLTNRAQGRMPLDAINRLRPWAASAIVMTMGAATSPNGSASAEPMDLVIHQRARQASKTLVFLETLQQQAGFMNRVPNEVFVEAIERSLLSEGDQAQDQVTDLLRAYRAGDSDRILELTYDPETVQRHPEFLDIILSQRNAAWAPRLLEVLAEGQAFIAVGLAHLIGPGGLLETLESNGYTLRRLSRPEGEADESSDPRSDLPPEHQPTLEVSLSPEEGLMTGDLLTLRIEAIANPDDELTVPDQDFSPFEIHARRSSDHVTEDGQRRHEFELDLLILEPGDHDLPPVRLRVMTPDGTLGSIHTDGHTVHVGSLIANEPDAQAKPRTEPVIVRERDETLVWLASALGIVLATILLTLLFLRWWRRRPKAEPPPPPPRPAWDVAREKLGQLEGQMGAAFASGDAVLWVDKLSDVMREYLGNRFDFDGLESTTDEIISRLRRLRSYQSILPQIISLLGECDLVQFAKAPAESERSTELLRQARDIVSRTQPSSRSEPLSAASEDT